MCLLQRSGVDYLIPGSLLQTPSHPPQGTELLPVSHLTAPQLCPVQTLQHCLGFSPEAIARLRL